MYFMVDTRQWNINIYSMENTHKKVKGIFCWRYEQKKNWGIYSMALVGQKLRLRYWVDNSLNNWTNVFAPSNKYEQIRYERVFYGRNKQMKVKCMFYFSHDTVIGMQEKKWKKKIQLHQFTKWNMALNKKYTQQNV